MDESAKIKNSKNATDLEIPKKGASIKFKDLDFAYNRNEKILHKINLIVPAGKSIALVGLSGSGKTTLLNLVPRFYDVKEGAITVNGTNIRDVTMESLRKNIALVSQEVMLFDNTIRANIAYGNPDATEEEILEAAKAAAAHSFITRLPDGYDTMVGEQGVNLSGGQRQRIAIARAMLKDAPILLLDEATSALDNRSERQVQAALDKLMEGRTVIMVAHRLSTIQHADCIYVMDEGCIKEFGTHEDLLAKGGRYAKLYNMSFDTSDAEAPTEAANASDEVIGKASNA